ncbi:MAG TPA: putative hydro-lyase [Symbiobacteriaceae bacterium]|nr:putative hydro-lyase [Symbiobacteriaceae bacterium]
MYKTAQEVWQACREGVWRRPTAGLAPGFAQANLVILPKDDAFDFLRLAQRNPKPMPVLEVLEPGDPEPKLTAPGADLRTDLPKYRVYKNGELVGERDEIRDLWRSDLVAFLIGCSFTFEKSLIDAGLPVRHIDCGCNVPMYRTNRMCVPAGRFSGPMVVSMRPIPAHLVPKAVTVTARYPAVHGAPVHIGAPEALGIADLGRPDWGDPVPVNPGEVPVFWACGVTPQAVAIQSKPEFMITHAPGYMFITAMLDEQVASS